MGLRQLAKDWLPPAVLRAMRRMRAPQGPPEWEYCPQGWRTAAPEIKGWNVASVADAQRRTWPAFAELATGTGPLGINHTDLEPGTDSYIAHNVVMAFGYALALAAAGKDRVSILDWGGGVGHYGVFAKSLLPEIRIDYHCKEVPVLCAAGREVLPEGTFYETWEECAARAYDLVLVSGSLHYSERWQDTLRDLAGVTGSYLLVTRLPMVMEAPSFVVVQRPYGCGYDTEYLGWCLNRAELLGAADAAGVRLVRELLVDERPPVHNAPEQPEYRGYLLRRR
jgi:putative methyltransferase (TIGR04325 family)